MKHRFSIALIILLIITITLTNLPDFHPESIMGFQYSLPLDMVFHGSYYLVATLVFMFLVRGRLTVSYLLLLLIIPALLEFSQYFVHGRSVSVHDFIANYLGVGLAISLYYLFRYFLKSRSTSLSSRKV